ncbi:MULTISPECIES: glycosyltransferase family 32 protein [Sphingobacterium]|uniref:Mannosyltransferase OCH1-like enzyme n=1 Tax=Sphingobacterium zeae TaxID=1776859 RepID=A0ABU0U4W8_9SPHI|nr:MULTISPECIES: glycosyltransferase [Sphingobacterium]MDQ1149263.1 mannosyltransferase OCH1-like enzyme [Sphingobacterium zeae]
MIEPIIHQILLSDIPNSLIYKCLTSWTKMKNFGFKIKYWNHVEISDFISINYPNALQAFINARNLAEASDIARYLIVLHHSGIYVDWDIELVDSSDYYRKISNLDKGYLLQDPRNGTFAPECFSAEKNEPFLSKLTDDIISVYNSRQLPLTPYYSGAYRMRESMNDYYCNQQILPVKDIFEFDYSEIREPFQRQVKKPLIHYWLHTWL